MAETALAAILPKDSRTGKDIQGGQEADMEMMCHHKAMPTSRCCPPNHPSEAPSSGPYCGCSSLRMKNVGNVPQSSNAGSTSAGGSNDWDAVVSLGPLLKRCCHCRCRRIIFPYGSGPRDKKEQYQALIASSQMIVGLVVLGKFGSRYADGSTIACCIPVCTISTM